MGKCEQGEGGGGFFGLVSTTERGEGKEREGRGHSSFSFFLLFSFFRLSVLGARAPAAKK